MASQAEGRGFETRVPLRDIPQGSGAGQNDRGPTWTELLRAAERGDEEQTRALAIQLAHWVLASPGIQLAHEVLAGGPHATAKAIELAERILNGGASPGGVVPAAEGAR